MQRKKNKAKAMTRRERKTSASCVECENYHVMREALRPPTYVDLVKYRQHCATCANELKTRIDSSDFVDRREHALLLSAQSKYARDWRFADSAIRTDEEKRAAATVRVAVTARAIRDAATRRQQAQEQEQAQERKEQALRDAETARQVRDKQWADLEASMLARARRLTPAQQEADEERLASEMADSPLPPDLARFYNPEPHSEAEEKAAAAQLQRILNLQAPPPTARPRRGPV